MNEISQNELYTRLTKALNALEQSRKRVHTLEALLCEPIAVIGLSCYLPGGIEHPDAFWQSLSDQKNEVTSLPDERWSTDDLVNATQQQPGKMISDQGGFIRHHEHFDAGFFGISPREAATMDPQQRLVLKSSWRALEHAGIAPDTLKGSDAGVFVGVTNTDYGHSLLKSSDIQTIDAYSATGNALNVIAGRVSYFLDIHGPSMAIDTACSSSLVALHHACHSLRQEECHLALCSGVNVILLPEGNIALSQANMLSPEGRCYTFDKRANGYVRSEGCVTLLLKRHSDAKKAGDKIYALIKGTAVNHGGRSSGLTVPNANAQAKLIRQALKNANLKASDIDYIETHGTGTALGDPIEINALNEVFADKQRVDNPLLIGSVKTNFGHLESASGLLGVLKVILAMQQHTLPPTHHFDTINPMIDLDIIPAQVVVNNTPWLGDKTAGVSSFGFSGINAHAVISSCESVVHKHPAVVDRSHHLLTCSAKDENALAVQREQLITFLLNNTEKNLSDIAYNYAVCRNHFPLRQAFVAKNIPDLLNKLTKNSTMLSHSDVQTIKRKRIAVLLSGQGSQYFSMGKVLYQSSTLFKNCIDHGCENLNIKLGYRLQDIMFADDDERLHQTLHTQPILFIFNYALVKLWESWGIVADCYIGHSIGEYLAATCAGVMEFDEALALVVERARLMQNLDVAGGMLLVMATKEQLAPILKANDYAVDIAIITNDYTVLSGLKSDLDKLEQSLVFITKPLQVSHAFHSALMDPILLPFYEFAKQLAYKAPTKSVISTIDGEFYKKTTVTADYWVQHVRQAVDLQKSMATLAAQHYDILLEIGPRPTFSKSSEQLTALKWCYSLRREMDDWQALLMNLASLYESGVTIHWQNVYADYDRQTISIPGYVFQEKNYWALPSRQQTPKFETSSDALYCIKNQEQQLPLTQQAALEGPTLLITRCAKLIKAVTEVCTNLVVTSQLQDVPPQVFPQVIFALQAHANDLTLEIKTQYELFLGLIKTLMQNPDQRVTVWLVTDSGSLSQAPLLGLRKCLLLESSHIDCIHVEADTNEWDDVFCQQIIAEILSKHDEKQIIYQNGKRYVPRLKPLQAQDLLQRTVRINKDACYLITGGQGALAHEVARWYVAQGAEHIILLSRRTATVATQALIKAALRKSCIIDCLAIDVSDQAALNQLFLQFGHSRPVLKGIVHAAGVLDDGLIQQQTWARFKGLFNAKILGSWYLHQLTAQCNLDHFILFSSMASLLGTPGQANYAAANAFLDRLAAFRQAQNLPALSINWGPWSEIGMAKDIVSRAPGLLKLAPQQGMALFNTLMQGVYPSQVMAANINWTKTFKQSAAKITFLDYFKEDITSSNAQPTPITLDIYALQTLSVEQVKALMLMQLQRQFQQILRLDRPLELNENFFELGMDSLMAIELRNNLETLMSHQVSLSQTVLFELQTLADLSDYLVKAIHGSTVTDPINSLLSPEELLLTTLDELSEDEID
jgi:acyl transferase domain-containing protein/acyl carrier protein